MIPPTVARDAGPWHAQIMPRRRILAFVFLISAMASSPAYAFDFRKVSGQRCAAGEVMVTVAEASRNAQRICSRLGRWDIVRLAGGGSIDGSGYGCERRRSDTRALGHVLCRRADRPRASVPQPMPAGQRRTQATSCRDALQNRVAWDYKGSRRWAPNNIEQLCGQVNHTEPARCFQRVMHGGVSWGESTRWQWKNALSLCTESQNADQTVACFQRTVRRDGWKKAIQACGPRSFARIGSAPPPPPDPRDRQRLQGRRLRSGRVVLQSDLGTYVGRCRNCQRMVGRSRDSATVHVNNPSAAFARFEMEVLDNGKVAFRADTGRYLARCRGCVPGAPSDTVTVHVDAARPPSYAQFRPVPMGRGRFALQADTGKYVARCRNCSPRAKTPDTLTIHESSPSAGYAQWRIVYVDR